MDAKPSILIVDDERLNIKVLVDLLKPTYKIMAATNGEQALKAARSGPALIVLGFMMPEMDGFEVCRRLCSWRSPDRCAKRRPKKTRRPQAS